MSYVGNTPTQQAFTPAVDFFNGDGSTVAFTLSKPVASVAQVQAVISNVPQNPGSAFTVSGNTITFTSAPPSGTSNIYVYYTSPITQVIAPGQGTVTTTALMDSSVTTAKIADGAVTPAKLSTGAPTWDTSSNLIATGRIQKSGTTTVISLNTGEAYGSSATLGIITTDSGADAINMRLYNGSYYYPFQFNKYGVMSVGGATAATSGAGITFPATQSASTDANTLDDYEEGTFSPTFNGTSTNPTVTYNGQNGNYIKVGRLCFVSIALGWTSFSGGSGLLRIGNLPFEPSQSNNMRAVGSMPFTSGFTGLTNGASIEPHTNLASAAAGTYFYMKDSGGNQVSYVDVTNIASSGNIQVALMYFTTN